MLAVIQDHESLLVAQRSSHLAGQIRPAPRLDAYRLSQFDHRQRRIPDRDQVNEHRGVSVALGVRGRARDGETGLAYAWRPGQRDQPGVRIREHPGYRRQLAFPAYKQVGRRRQATGRCLPRVLHPTAPPMSSIRVATRPYPSIRRPIAPPPSPPNEGCGGPAHTTM